MKLEFLCGCITGEVVDPDNLRTMSSVTLDEEGFLICQIHRERRKNWRGGRMTISTEERIMEERLEVYGWAEEIKLTPFDINFATVDCRDNRDPQLIGHEILTNPNTIAEIRHNIENPEMNGKLSSDGIELLKRNRGL